MKLGMNILFGCSWALAPTGVGAYQTLLFPHFIKKQPRHYIKDIIPVFMIFLSSTTQFNYHSAVQHTNPDWLVQAEENMTTSPNFSEVI